MALAIAIKNIILVVLIILILHFWLKSIVLSKKETYCPPTPNTKLGDNKVVASPSKDATVQNELLKYVNEGDDDDLDRFFKNNPVTTDVDQAASSKDDVCKMKRDDTQLPLAQTCDTKVQKLEDVAPEAPRIKGECDLKQDKKNMMILAEYENEKDINGGSLFGDLNAFDTFDVNYESYASSCSPVV